MALIECDVYVLNREEGYWVTAALALLKDKKKQAEEMLAYHVHISQALYEHIEKNIIVTSKEDFARDFPLKAWQVPSAPAINIPVVFNISPPPNYPRTPASAVFALESLGMIVDEADGAYVLVDEDKDEEQVHSNPKATYCHNALDRKLIEIALKALVAQALAAITPPLTAEKIQKIMETPAQWHEYKFQIRLEPMSEESAEHCQQAREFATLVLSELTEGKCKLHLVKTQKELKQTLAAARGEQPVANPESDKTTLSFP